MFNFPYDVEEDDEETIVENAALRVRSVSAASSARVHEEVEAQLTRWSPLSPRTPADPSPLRSRWIGRGD